MIDEASFATVELSSCPTMRMSTSPPSFVAAVTVASVPFQDCKM